MSADIEINDTLTLSLTTTSVFVQADGISYCDECSNEVEVDLGSRLESRDQIEKLIAGLRHARDTLFPVSVANDPNGCDGWPNETVYDVINVLEAWRDHELQYVEAPHLAKAQELGLMDEDRATEAGKLLLLGFAASQTVAEVEKGLLFQEIEKLKGEE